MRGIEPIFRHFKDLKFKPSHRLTLSDQYLAATMPGEEGLEQKDDKVCHRREGFYAKE